MEVCKVEITVCVLRDGPADMNLRMAGDRSGSLLQLCYAPVPSLPPLGMKEAVYTMSGSPTQGRAGAFALNYSDKKHSIPASHTTVYPSRGETAAQRGTWFAGSFP